MNPIQIMRLHAFGNLMLITLVFTYNALFRHALDWCRKYSFELHVLVSFTEMSTNALFLVCAQHRPMAAAMALEKCLHVKTLNTRSAKRKTFSLILGRPDSGTGAIHNTCFPTRRSGKKSPWLPSVQYY